MSSPRRRFVSEATRAACQPRSSVDTLSVSDRRETLRHLFLGSHTVRSGRQAIDPVMQSEQPRRRKIRLLTRLAEADKQIGKLRLLKTEMMHRLAEAEFRLLLRRPASSWETFILFFYWFSRSPHQFVIRE